VTGPWFERRFRAWAEGRGVGWREVRYPRPEAGGETRAYRLTPPESPRGRVLVTHGAGNDALFGFVTLFKALLAGGYEVFSFDMDGHGRESTTTLSPAAVGSAVPAALAAAGDGDGLPLHAVGVSFGGAVLLRALADSPGRFASAVLMVTPLRIHFSATGVLRELNARACATVLRERTHYGLTGLIPSFGPVKRGAYPLRLEGRAPGAFGYVDTLNDLLATLALEEAAAAVETPVLLVYGGRDRVVPPEQGRTLEVRLPRAELRVLPRETHPTAPLAPQAIEGAVRWIGRHTAEAE
jgi:alpha-beta hydrolase superfamily lysophospholipase